MSAAALLQESAHTCGTGPTLPQHFLATWQWLLVRLNFGNIKFDRCKYACWDADKPGFRHEWVTFWAIIQEKRHWIFWMGEELLITPPGGPKVASYLKYVISSLTIRWHGYNNFHDIWNMLTSPLRPCHTLPYCISVCRRMWIFTNTVVYAEIRYVYVWHK